MSNTIGQQVAWRRQASLVATKQVGEGIYDAMLPTYDPSLATPEQQQQYLADMLEAADTANPAPFTGTPPFGETIDQDEYVDQSVLDENYEIAPDLEAAANADLLHLTSESRAQEPQPERDWYNDPQYYGLGVPPGIENLDQPIESGHTQITPPNSSSEHGWDAWSGRVPLARVARHENYFPGYSKGVKRGNGTRKVEKWAMPLALQTQMYRDMLLTELKRRGVHSVVVQDTPSVPYTSQVLQVDPSALAPQGDIGPEGVLP